jgi:integrase/recombinase XerC
MLDNFEIYLTTERRMSLHTVKAYCSDVNNFLEFSSIDTFEELKELSYQNVRAWMVSLIDEGCANRSVNRKLSSLRTFFNWCEKQGSLNVNPMLRIKGPKQEKRLPEFVKQEELDGLAGKVLFPDGVLGQRDFLILELFYQTGIRLDELIHIGLKDVQDQSIKVIGKRNKERIIPVSPMFYKQLKEFSENAKQQFPDLDYLFFTDKGRKLYPKFVYRKINNYLSKLTRLEKTSPHVLRHTFATHMLNSGAGLETLKELLGHANLSATQVYTHNSFEELSKIYKQSHPRG